MQTLWQEKTIFIARERKSSLKKIQLTTMTLGRLSKMLCLVLKILINIVWPVVYKVIGWSCLVLKQTDEKASCKKKKKKKTNTVLQGWLIKADNASR